MLCTDALKNATTVKDEPSGLGRAHWVFFVSIESKDASVSDVKRYICEGRQASFWWCLVHCSTVTVSNLV